MFTGSCCEPDDPMDRPLRSISHEDIDGEYPVGTEAYFECELDNTTGRVTEHPSVCQPNGTWTNYTCFSNINVSYLSIFLIDTFLITD